MVSWHICHPHNWHCHILWSFEQLVNSSHSNLPGIMTYFLLLFAAVNFSLNTRYPSMLACAHPKGGGCGFPLLSKKSIHPCYCYSCCCFVVYSFTMYKISNVIAIAVVAFVVYSFTMYKISNVIAIAVVGFVWTLHISLSGSTPTHITRHPPNCISVIRTLLTRSFTLSWFWAIMKLYEVTS